MVESRRAATLGVTIAVLVTSTIFVFFRFVSRGYIVRRIQADDWVILLAWFLAFGLSFSICYGTSVGLGRHNADVKEGWHVPLQKAEYAFSVLYQPTLMATKTSIIIFFLSLARQERVFRWLNYLTLFVVNVAGIALTILSIVQCRPIEATFEYPASTNAQCIDIVALYLSSAPVNLITDAALLFLPMPILTKMRLPRKQKAILVVTFSFGVFVAVVDVIRIAYLQKAAFARVADAESANASSGRFQEDSDFSWYASLSFMWTAVEVNVGIMCACVPSLKPLFQRFLPSFIRDEGDQTNKYGSFTSASQRSPSQEGGELDPITNPAAVRQASEVGAPPVTPDANGEMGFMDFLSTAEADAPMHRTGTNGTTGTLGTATSRGAPTFFDFVNMKKPKNLLRLSNRESFMPNAIVTILFFMWGFAYGFLNILNQQFSVVVAVSQAQSLGLHASYFAGYFLGPLTIGHWIFKSFGFKATMICALVIYACGTLIFWPSAVLTSYTAYIISNLIVGMGLSILELASNPFITFCGPMEYAEIRLNLSQGFQAIGTVVSPLLAKKVLFRNVLDAPSLIDVQWTYLAIGIFDILLAVALYYIHLPEATDEDFEHAAERRAAVNSAKLGGKIPVIWTTLGLGVLSQFCYVAGQEGIGTMTGSLVDILRPGIRGRLSAFDYVTVGHTVFAVGRFFSAFLNYVFKPRWILLGLYIGLIVTMAVIMSVTGKASLVMLMFSYFFESGVFSIVYAMALRGMGANTKTAAVFMTAAISGGAVLVPLQRAVSNSHGVRYSFSVVLGTFILGAVFAIYLNIVPKARAQVDPYHEKSRRHHHGRRGPTSTVALDLNSNINSFGFLGIVARYQRQKERYRMRHEKETRDVSSQHVERSSQVANTMRDVSPAHDVHDFAKNAKPPNEKLPYDDLGGCKDLEILGQGKLDDSEGLMEKGREREYQRASQAFDAVPSLLGNGDDRVGASSAASEQPSSSSTLGKGLMHDLEEWPSTTDTRAGSPAATRRDDDPEKRAST